MQQEVDANKEYRYRLGASRINYRGPRVTTDIAKNTPATLLPEKKRWPPEERTYYMMFWDQYDDTGIPVQGESDQNVERHVGAMLLSSQTGVYWLWCTFRYNLYGLVAMALIILRILHNIGTNYSQAGRCR